MDPAAIGIEHVTGRAAERAFCDLPYRLYRGDARWVPPLRATELRRWSPRHNASLHGRATGRFLARRGGRVVGRIAATVDPVFAERWQPGAGFFGFYESLPDPEASRALFEAAERFLRERGVTTVVGPVNLCTHDEVGLLVEGFAHPPTLLTSYNPPHYETQIRAAGYVARLDYHAYRCDPHFVHEPVIDRLLRRTRGAQGSDDVVTVRATDPRRWDDEIRLLFDLYNRSFVNLWGFVPIGWDEFRQRAEDFRPFHRPVLSLFAERGGRPVGFAVALPDINVALAGLGGRIWPFGWLRLMLRVPRIRSLRLMLLGVVPEATGLGVAGHLAYGVASAARRLGMRGSELSLVQAGNHRIQRVIRAFGGVRFRTYRLYERML